MFVPFDMTLTDDITSLDMMCIDERLMWMYSGMVYSMALSVTRVSAVACPTAVGCITRCLAGHVVQELCQTNYQLGRQELVWQIQEPLTWENIVLEEISCNFDLIKHL